MTGAALNDITGMDGGRADHTGGDGGERGSSIARVDDQRGVAVGGESGALISMIERAARDPNVDIDKMERLFQMHERMTATTARLAYDAAFSAMQPELPEIDKRGKIVIRDKHDTEKIIQSTPYALWEDTIKLIKPILARHGFGLSFRISQTDARLTTRAVLSHCAGHREETEFASPIDATGSKNNVQGWGSAFSYGKRYTGTAILNITTRGEDDDGKAAGAGATITDEQAEQIKTALEDTGGQLPRFCAYFKLAKLTDLPSAKFDSAMAMIRKASKGRANG
jgi:hypothetical protein